MTRRSSVSPAWFTPVWTVGGAVITAIVFGTIFYVTTNSTLSQHSNAITDLTKVLKDESQARVAMEKAEATQREKLRSEYMAMMERQTQSFGAATEKIGAVATDVKVLSTKYDTINEQIKKVLDQTAPRGARR